MSRGLVEVSLKDAKELTQHLGNLKKNLAVVEQRAFRDMNSRGPTQVAKAVTSKYNIKAAEVKPGGKVKMAGGTIARTGGSTVADWSISYKGRLLTTYGRFSVTPKNPTPGRAYRLKATIKKKNKKEIGHWKRPWSEGGKYSQESPYFAGQGQLAGFVTRRKGRKLQVFRTLSIPQMVANEEVSQQAIENLQELAQKRIDHYFDRLITNGKI